MKQPETAALRKASAAQPPRSPLPSKPQDGKTAKPADGKAPAEEKPDVPYVAEVKEVMRTFVIAEKNYRLYPVHGKVVKHSLQGFYETLGIFHNVSEDPLYLRVNQMSFLYGEEEVYEEPQRAKNLAHTLYKDGVRWLVFLEDMTLDELGALLSCFKEVIEAEAEEDDFSTLFWEKDCTNIQLQLVDDSEKEKDENTIVAPTVHLFTLGFNREKLSISREEEERLRDEISRSKQEDRKGEDTFELAEEEIESIRKLSRAEEEYFAVYDFVDILIEHMAGNPDPKAFEDAAKLIRTIIFALVEELDFEHAAILLGKISLNPHPALTEAQRRRVREMVGSFCDKETLQVLATFLEEQNQLSKGHPVFKFMKLFTKDAVPQFCEFLSNHPHIPALCQVLSHIGKACGSTFAKHLMGPDPLVARAMIPVILQIEAKTTAVERIATALQHPDEEVRKTAAKVILEQGDEKVGALFVPLLEDPPLVSTALQFYAKVPYADAYAGLAKLIKGNAFHQLDPPRQLLCFKGLILASREQSIEFIRHSVLGWGFCLTQRSRRRMAAALRALVLHQSDAAREILLKFSEMKRSPLAGIAAQALQTLGKGLKNPEAEMASPETPPAIAGQREPRKEVQGV